MSGLFLLTVGSAYAKQEQLQIVTTTSDLASIAASIAGEKAEASSIVNGHRDPHFIQAKPGYIMQARTADLWIRIGMQLEIGWEPPILRGARNPDIQEGAAGHVDASDNVVRLGVTNKRITRAMGDVHPAGNPHYWLDPLNGRIVAETIAERLINLQPENADTFRKNLAAFQTRLDEHMFGQALVAQAGGSKLWALHLNGELDSFLSEANKTDLLGGWLGQLRAYENAPLIIYHRSWNYFTHRFGFRIAAELEPKPGIPPTASHLQNVIKTAARKNVQAILIEPYYNRKAADKVAAETDARVIVCANSVGGQAEATDYIALMDLIVEKLEKALSQ